VADAGVDEVEDVYAHLVATALVRGRWAVFRPAGLNFANTYETCLAPAQMALIDFVVEGTFSDAGRGAWPACSMVRSHRWRLPGRPRSREPVRSGTLDGSRD